LYGFEIYFGRKNKRGGARRRVQSDLAANVIKNLVAQVSKLLFCFISFYLVA